MNELIQEVTYAEYMKLLTGTERELLIILQAHGIMPCAAHEIMSLNKILKRFYNSECITIDEIVQSLHECQNISKEKLDIIRM